MKIEVSNVRAGYFSHEVLHSVSLKVGSGEAICILGENSSGKSTLLKCICKLKKYTGQITYEKGLKIFYLPQENILMEELKVRDNVKLFLHTCGKEEERYIRDKTGMEDILYKKVQHLSEGMKRRVSLCIALLDESQVLILDEPFVGMDKASRQVFVSELEKVLERGKSILYTSHVEDTTNKTSRKVYLKNGNLEEIE